MNRAIPREAWSLYRTMTATNRSHRDPCVRLAGSDSARGAREQRRLAERLLRCVHTEVLRVVVRHGARAGRRSPQDAADLTQEVMVAMFDRNARELRRWDPERGLGFEGFVRLVARRRVARTLARQRGNSRVVVPVEPSTVEQHPDVTGARRVEVRGQLEQVLRRLQPKMSVRDRTLFELLYVEEHEPAVVARRMAMTRGAVNAWSYRLRKLATAVA